MHRPANRSSCRRTRTSISRSRCPTGWHVNWLTSAGQLFQDDEPRSFIHIAPKDRQQGELACVIRDTDGGVVWKVWPLAAQ